MLYEAAYRHVSLIFQSKFVLELGYLLRSYVCAIGFAPFCSVVVAIYYFELRTCLWGEGKVKRLT